LLVFRFFLSYAEKTFVIATMLILWQYTIVAWSGGRSSKPGHIEMSSEFIRLLGLDVQFPLNVRRWPPLQHKHRTNIHYNRRSSHWNLTN